MLLHQADNRNFQSKTCVAFVTYNKYGNYDWTKICVSSFKSVFGESVPLIAVDHNRNPLEIKYLVKNNIRVISNDSEDLSHGYGLDLAVKYASGIYDNIIFIEPDCIVKGRKWFDNIEVALLDYSMAATFGHIHGSLHPCGSGWRITDIPGSFKLCDKTSDEIFHEKHQSLIKMDILMQDITSKKYSNALCHFFVYSWDVGIRNWYLLALKDKTIKVDGDDLLHLWHSHQIPLKENVWNNPWIKSYIESFLYANEVKVLC